MTPRPLPAAAHQLCHDLQAPPLLVAHLTLVHDAACDLLEALHAHWPKLSLDDEAMLFGAATHDLGKAVYPAELTGPGRFHELHGERLLLEQGVPPRLARFASTHDAWRSDRDLELEDLLVAWADQLWKGSRPPQLELLVAAAIAAQVHGDDIAVFLELDEIAERIAADALDRLAWQRQ